jgi:hypothetical protein
VRGGAVARFLQQPAGGGFGVEFWRWHWCLWPFCVGVGVGMSVGVGVCVSWCWCKWWVGVNVADNILGRIVSTLTANSRVKPSHFVTSSTTSNPQQRVPCALQRDIKPRPVSKCFLGRTRVLEQHHHRRARCQAPNPGTSGRHKVPWLQRFCDGVPQCQVQRSYCRWQRSYCR